jgi:hypothetical protein
VSGAVRSHAMCVYRPPGMSGHPMVLATGKGNNSGRLTKKKFGSFVVASQQPR